MGFTGDEWVPTTADSSSSEIKYLYNKTAYSGVSISRPSAYRQASSTKITNYRNSRSSELCREGKGVPTGWCCICKATAKGIFQENRRRWLNNLQGKPIYVVAGVKWWGLGFLHIYLLNSWDTDHPGPDGWYRKAKPWFCYKEDREDRYAAKWYKPKRLESIDLTPPTLIS